MTDTSELCKLESLAIIKQKHLGSRKYKLLKGICANCGKLGYELWCDYGDWISKYRFGDSFKEKEFEEFAYKLYKATDINSPLVATIYNMYINKIVDKDYSVCADEFDLLFLNEYIRILMRGFLDKKEDCFFIDGENEEEGRKLRFIFELGVLAAEYRIVREHGRDLEKILSLEEWRERGLLAAREERKRQGRRTRQAVIKAAQKLYKKRPDLIRNDTATAREIQKLDISELTKANGQPISIDAITKHLRSWRKENR